MDEILTSTSAELDDLAWLSSAMNHPGDSNAVSGSAVSSSTHTPWTMADESGDHDTTDFFSDEHSEEIIPCIKRPRKSTFFFQRSFDFALLNAQQILNARWSIVTTM